jgi:hypothetical protein
MNALYLVRMHHPSASKASTLLVDVRRQAPAADEREAAKKEALQHVKDPWLSWSCVGLQFVCETPNRVAMSVT